MNKLFPFAILLVAAAFADTANAGWTYRVSATSLPVKTATKGVATVMIEAPRDYTFGTDELPRLTVAASDGITITKVSRVTRNPSRPDVRSAAFEIALKASKEGRHTLAADVDFSLCAGGTCEPKHERLTFDVVAQ